MSLEYSRAAAGSGTRRALFPGREAQAGRSVGSKHPLGLAVLLGSGFGDFQYRGIDRQDLRGWSWYQGRGLGVPESNASRHQNRDKKVTVKIHPGLGTWRSILGRNILGAVHDLSLESVFIDVTLVSHNLHNCLVDGMTSTEGMNRLIRHVAGLGAGLVVGGEGLRMRLHVEHGAIPTVTIRSASDIDNPNSAVRRMFEMAG